MTYEEYKIREQKAFNDLPIFFAFSNEQFKREMEKRGLTENDTDKIYSLGGGGYYLKSDAQIIRDFAEKPDELPELMKNHEFAVSAFVYEMQNHEYAINYYQGDWDVCSCFGECEYGEDKTYKDYLSEIGFDEDIINAFKEAKGKYRQLCIENDWF